MSLKIENITKIFPLDNGATFQALKGINLEIQKGEFCTLLGPSGCGKTTLLRIIAGFERASSGKINFHGKDYCRIPVYERNFPMVFQSYALFPHMTVIENISYGLKMKKVPKAEAALRVDKVIELTGLTSNRDKYPHQMSGGQQQRVALARAIVMEPEVMLFDEPLSNLDANLRISMRNEIRALQKQLGITVVYVTHDQEEAMAVSDKIVVMNQGMIEQVGTPQEIYQTPKTEFVANFVGKANVLPVKEGKVLGQICEVAGKNNVVAVIRPEAISICDSGAFQGKIIDSTYLGSSWALKVECAGEEILITHPCSKQIESIKADQVISFVLPSEHLHFI